MATRAIFFLTLGAICVLSSATLVEFNIPSGKTKLVVGEPLNLELVAYTATRLVDSSFSGNVIVDDSGSAMSQTTVTMAAGKGFLTARDFVAETVTLSVLAQTGITFTQTLALEWTAGPAALLIATLASTSLTVDDTNTITFEARDAFNNVATGHSDTIAFTAAGSISPKQASVAISGGRGNITFSNAAVETVLVSLSSLAGISLSQPSFSVAYRAG
jgi:hypothetical protein